MGRHSRLVGPRSRGVVAAVVGLALLAGVGGCNSLFPACTDVLVFGIAVAPIDSVSGARIAGDAQVIASDGAYADTSTFSPTGSWVAVGVVEDRPGVYAVRVAAEGYAFWERRGVRVSRGDRCHVETVPLTARLSR